MFRRVAFAGAAAALLLAVPAASQTMPKEMSWTAYDTGSSGFNIALAIGQQFKQVQGVDVRVLPSGNDTGRLAPVKANSAVISQMGIGAYHDGTLRAFKEKGVWTDALQKHNDALIKRQATMIDAWKASAASSPSDDKAFAEGWLKARAATLAKAGIDVVFE